MMQLTASQREEIYHKSLDRICQNCKKDCKKEIMKNNQR